MRMLTRSTGFVLPSLICAESLSLGYHYHLCPFFIFCFSFPYSLQSKFESFCQYAKTFNSDTFDYEALKGTDFVFMRWKEHFLVPDHTIKDINGASFAGFYYICFQKSAASIEGFYYHRSSEW